MKHYEENLHHIMRPDKRSEKQTAPRVSMPDYAALYVARALSEYAAYEAQNRLAAGIALGLAEYIDHCVREEGRAVVTLYAHSGTARRVLVDALDAADHERDLHGSLMEDLRELYNDPQTAAGF